MNDNYELQALRAIREINLSIRELENQSAATSKRYKRGVKLLQSETTAIEASLDEGGSIEGMEPWNIQGEKLSLLIANPILENIEDDYLV